MHPLIGVLELGEVARPIGSYGVSVSLGLFVASALAVRAAQRAGQDVGRTIAAIAIVIGLGFASAWVTFLVVERLRTGTFDALAQGGGLVAFGALPGAAVALWLARRRLGLDALRILELALPGVAAGHAVGRVGCFLGGCCYGAPFDGPWAVVYSDPLAPAAFEAGIPRHPSPLYEAAGLLVLALAFALAPPRAPGAGRRLALYVGLYAALRFAVELTRGDAIRGVGPHGVSTSMALAVALGLGALVAARRLARDRPGC